VFYILQMLLGKYEFSLEPKVCNRPVVMKEECIICCITCKRPNKCM